MSRSAPRVGTYLFADCLIDAAYSAVTDPRMSFSQVQQPPMPYSNGLPPPPGLSTVPMVKKKKIEWPESVRSYVRRAFEPHHAIPGIAKEEVEAKLKEIISAATENNTLLTTDWDHMALPQVMISVAKQQAYWQQSSIAAYAGGPTYRLPHIDDQNKKRKSADLQDTTSPPWRTNNNNSIADRVTYATPVQAQRANALAESAGLKPSSKFQKNQDKRQKRFDGGYVSKYRSPTPEAATGPVIGRCEVLEKRYLRLTAAPNPDLVRPLHILKQTLEFLKKKWRKEANYSYICDQFKSLRQDLTVQHIKDKFTVEVYEIHARIALEKADLGEYNQCQTQLRALYAQGISGNHLEFKAYRILYFIHTANRTALNDVLADLTSAEKQDEAIKHALGVRSALAMGNYHKFFRLYLETPNMGAYLMDMFVVRERLSALAHICKA